MMEQCSPPVSSSTTCSNNKTPHPPPLRIACLIPSATDICIALGLGDSLVGVTHECHVPNRYLGNVRRLTSDGVRAATSTQGEIHAAVQHQSSQVLLEQQQQTSCSLSSTSVSITTSVPSLYPVLASELTAANPTIIFTQDLCNVCAPTSASVRQVLRRQPKPGSDDNNAEDDDTNPMDVTIVSLTPIDLADVIATFGTIADACGVSDRGQRMQADFVSSLDALSTIVQQAPLLQQQHQAPRMLLLEWLDPPFDAGHWMLDMMERVHVVNAASAFNSRKSIQRTWEDIATVHPDVVLIACCGFDLERNYTDAISMRASLIQSLSPEAVQRIYACHGDFYFANPGPKLLVGTAIMALAAYSNYPTIVEAIHQLPFVQQCGPDFEPFRHVDVTSLTTSSTTTTPSTEAGTDTAKEEAVSDIEDWDGVHRAACQAGHTTYVDPSTGYNVFTEVAHQARGKCCGSGCRHCPYAHENVRDKTAKIQQPAFLYTSQNDDEHENCQVLFMSGGKDSFLTIRATIRAATTDAFRLVLLTTFDATSRIIAHQDVSIDTVVRQARHLNLSLVGVPMHRGSSEGYVQRVQRGLALIGKKYGTIQALIFGDLHLEHIKGWRDEQLGPLGFKLLYPLFGVPFPELEQDLESSHVPCEVTSSTIDNVVVGEPFDATFRHRLRQEAPDVDLFGENGEFHTVAQVWMVDRAVALGL